MEECGSGTDVLPRLAGLALYVDLLADQSATGWVLPNQLHARHLPHGTSLAAGEE
jgi:hypothetical protein